MSEMSPVTGPAHCYKPGINSWEDSMDQQSPDDGSQFVEVGTQDQAVREIDACQTYTVVSEETNGGHCEAESPTERLCADSRPISVGYGYQDYPGSVGPVCSGQSTGGVCNGQTYPHQQVGSDQSERHSSNEVVLLQGHDSTIPTAAPQTPYGNEGLTHLANCCSEINTQMSTTGASVITPPVVHIPEELQGKSSICIQLDHAELWEQFYSVDTEMIITKAGRRMFPGISSSVFGLEPDAKYTLQMEMWSATKNRYKYINSKWMSVGKGEPHEAAQMIFTHPDSPASGKQWMRDKVSYKKIKLTNDKSSKKGYVVLNSMHKYQPRIHVLRHLNKKETTLVYSIDFPQTQFVAVTAYQNDLVTQLKIDNNPFAKAFREPDDQHCRYPGLMVGGGWGIPTTPTLHSPAESTFSNGSSSISSLSPLPQFNMAFGNWDMNARPPVSPFLSKPDRTLPQWPYPVPITPSVSSSMLVPPYPSALLPTSATERVYTAVPPSYLRQPFPLPPTPASSRSGSHGSEQKSPASNVD